MCSRKVQQYLKAICIVIIVALSPYTPNEVLPSILIGSFFAVIYLVFFADKNFEPSKRKTEQRPISEWIHLGALLILSVFVFAHTLKWLYRSWTLSIWHNGHGLFLPFIMYYLSKGIIERRRDLNDEEGSAWGFAILLPALGLVAIDSGIQTNYLSATGLVLTLPALSLLIFGKKRTKALAFPFALGLFLVPLPLEISRILNLRLIAAESAAKLFNLIGFPVFRDNYTIHFHNTAFYVADACSGYATIYAGIIISLVLFYLSKSRSRKITVLLTVIPLCIVTNIVRVAVLVALANRFGRKILELPLHEATGVFAFLFTSVVLARISGIHVLRKSAS